MIWGIIGAMETEIALIKQKMQITQTTQLFGTTFYRGIVSDKEIVLVCCGIGTINATVCALTLIREFGADCVINVGIAGAMNKNLRLLDVVIADEVMFHDADLDIICQCYPYQKSFTCDQNLVALCKKACDALPERTFTYYTGRIASGDKFVNSNQERVRIQTLCDPYCVEMEGAAIGQMAYINQKPFVILRTMSDNADDDTNQTYDNWMDIAANNAANIILKMLEIG